MAPKTKKDPKESRKKIVEEELSDKEHSINETTVVVEQHEIVEHREPDTSSAHSSEEDCSKQLTKCIEKRIKQPVRFERSNQFEQHTNQEKSVRPERSNYVERTTYAERSRSARPNYSERIPKHKSNSSAMNFNFRDKVNLTTPVNTSTDRELLEVLVSRASINGQLEFFRVLRQTLQALNHECKFPVTELPKQVYQPPARALGSHTSPGRGYPGISSHISMNKDHTHNGSD